MTEQERIESIKKNGGKILSSFKKENVTYAMCLAAVKDDGSVIYSVPEEFRTKEIWQLAAKTYSIAVDLMPKKYLTQKVWADVVKIDGTNLHRVPAQYVTELMCLDAVCQNPQSFVFVPKEIMSAQFCGKAVKKTGKIDILQSLPEGYKNAAFYMELLEECPQVFSIIPKKFRTAAVCKKAIKELKIASVADEVKRNPSFFSMIHPSLYDHDACMAFVQSNAFSRMTNTDYWISVTDKRVEKSEVGRILQFPDVAKVAVSYSVGYFPYVPDKAVTAELCEIAIDQYSGMIKYVPERFLTVQLCEKAVKKDGNAIQYIPESMLNPQLCGIAVAKDGKAIELVPEKKRTKELVELAFATYPECFKMYSEEDKDEKKCLEAVSRIGGLLKDVPESLRNYEICYAAAVHGASVEDIPELLLDKKMALAVVGNGNISDQDTIPLLFKKVPDPDVYLVAVKKKGEMLKYVPETAKTYEMCVAAMNNSLLAVNYIPDSMFSDEIRSIYARNYVLWNGMRFPEKHQTVQMWLEIFSRPESGALYVLNAVPPWLLNQEICDAAVRRSYTLYREIPDEFITEDMIMYIAYTAPGQLGFRFPERFRTKEFITKVTDKYPETKLWLQKAGIECE